MLQWKKKPHLLSVVVSAQVQSHLPLPLAAFQLESFLVFPAPVWSVCRAQCVCVCVGVRVEWVKVVSPLTCGPLTVGPWEPQTKLIPEVGILSAVIQRLKGTLC